MLNRLLGRLEDGFIVIEVGSGLGDRMSSLASTILLGRELGKRVYLGWVLNGALGCRFEELFELPDNDFELLRHPAGKRPSPSFHHPLLRLVAKLNASAAGWLISARENALLRCRYQFDAVLKPHYKVQGSRDLRREVVNMPSMSTLRAKRRIYIGTHLDLYWLLNPGAPVRRYDYLRPTAELRERIEAITDGFMDRTVGIHIRQGDVDFFRRRRSPISAIIKLMREEVARDDSVQFYLATESHTVISRLRVLFGDRLIVQPGLVLGRKHAAGMKSAVVDMWALSRTRKMIGGWSQFTRLAAQLNGAELQVVDVTENEEAWTV